MQLEAFLVMYRQLPLFEEILSERDEVSHACLDSHL